MGGVPRIGQGLTLPSSAEELLDAPQAKVLGDIDLNPSSPASPSFDADGPPPWELDRGYFKHNTDARRFVTVPDSWELRWLNPRAISHNGLRDWQPVLATDKRVTIKNRAMIHTPEHYIRKGGQDGDILCYMPRSWVMSRMRLKAERAAKMAQSAVDRQQQAVEEIKRGNFGPNIAVDSYRHPTHTIGDARTMTDE
jgi:hypothetical protein